MATPETVKGIYVYGKKTFYYLDTGTAPASLTSVEKVLKILMMRDIIRIDNAEAGVSLDKQYKVLSLKEAEQDGLVMEPIYLSRHIKRVAAKEKTEGGARSKKWGRKDSPSNA